MGSINLLGCALVCSHLSSIFTCWSLRTETTRSSLDISLQSFEAGLARGYDASLMYWSW